MIKYQTICNHNQNFVIKKNHYLAKFSHIKKKHYSVKFSHIKKTNYLPKFSHIIKTNYLPTLAKFSLMKKNNYKA